MQEDIENIFKVGSPVEGDSFIGCEDVLNHLRRNIFINKNSLSLVGMHRMGKTSLMTRIHKEAEEIENLIPVFLDIKKYDRGTDSDYDEMLVGIIKILERRIKTKNFISAEQCNFIETFQNSVFGTNDFREKFQNVFEELKELGFRILLTLDEFDSAENIFKQPADYELFRELVNFKYGTSLVLISRRQLHMIEKKNESGSVFYGAVTKFPQIIGFSDRDVANFRNILAERYEIHLSDEHMEKIHYYAGNSPYIYSFFGFNLVELKQDNVEKIDIDNIYKINAATVMQYSEIIYNRLKIDGHLFKLIGVILGPKIDVTRQDIDILGSMGYLNLTQEGYNEIVSGYFTDYVKSKHIEGGDSWKNIIGVDTALKDLIKKEYGEISYDDWKNKVSTAYQKFLGNKFNDSKYQRDLEKNRHSGERFATEPSIIDIMSPKDVCIFIRLLWDRFSPYFGGKSFEVWQEKFESYIFARNPVAHNLGRFLTQNEVARTNVYCQEIIDAVRNTTTTIIEEPPQNLLSGKIFDAPDTDKKIVVNEKFINEKVTLREIDWNRKKNNLRGKFEIQNQIYFGTIQKEYAENLQIPHNREIEVKISALNPQRTGYLVKP